MKLQSKYVAHCLRVHELALVHIWFCAHTLRNRRELCVSGIYSIKVLMPHTNGVVIIDCLNMRKHTNNLYIVQQICWTYP